MNKKHALLAAVLLLVLLLGGYFVASPWVALARFKEDARARRTEKMADYVNFPAVQASLKAQMRNKIKAEVGRQDDDFAAATQILGAAVANLVLDPVVEKVASPQGMVAIMNGENPLPGLNKLDIAVQPPAQTAPPAPTPPQPNASPHAQAPGTASDAGAQPAQARRQWRLSYTGLNQAVIRAVPAEEDAPYLVMQRKGLFGWQVVDVQLGKLW
jgi:hypothetical protein